MGWQNFDSLYSPKKIPSYYVWIRELDSEEADKKNTDSFAVWCWGKALWRPWATRKMNKWILEQLKSETLLEAKMTKLKLFCA